MSKIAKYIKLALHNSSAAEAATALKMAAAQMSKEGVNPAEYLSEKGGSDYSAEVERLKADVTRLNGVISNCDKEIMNLRAQLKQAESKATGNHTASTRALQRQIEDLEDQALTYRRELREAKEVAINWCKKAEKLESENKVLAQASVNYSARADKLDKENEKLFSRLKLVAAVGVIGAVICWSMGNSTGEQGKYELQRRVNAQDTTITDQLSEIAELKAQLAAKPKAPVAVAKSAPNPFDQFDAPKPKKREVTKYTVDTECEAVGGSELALTFNVNTRTSTVLETTDHLPDGYSVSLPSHGTPNTGYIFNLTYADGTKIPCTVQSVY